MFTGKEWGTVLRFWADGLPAAYAKSSHVDSVERRMRLAEVGIADSLRGASIVMVVSLLERLVLDCLGAALPTPPKSVSLTDPSWRGQLGLTAWDGTTALNGLVSLRHCFAHEYGRVTARQQPIVATFLADLHAGRVSVTTNKGTLVLLPFFTIDAGDTLRPDAVNTSAALRPVVVGLLEQLAAAGHVVLS